MKTGTFYVFMLFTGVSLSITAFPVLARVLSELKMMKTTVGQTTITAASVDDVIAWCLLALVVALSKNSNGLSALYILLTGIGYVLAVFFIVKPLYLFLLRKQGFLTGRDPSPQIVFITFLMVFISAWFTDILGIHAIFGAYIIGVIVPHDSGFAIKLAEKIEDIVSIFFLPIYFALSGLKTDLGVLNTLKAWLLLILAVCVDMLGKIVGCGGAARYCKFTWRESITIGVLMSCKGLVELIVLNVGLETNVINQSVFSVLVLSALISTFLTTPIIRKIYPPKYHKLADEPAADAITINKTLPPSINTKLLYAGSPTSALISISRPTQLPSLLNLLNLINKTPIKHEKSIPNTNSESSVYLKQPSFVQKLNISVLRLVELTGRGTSVMLQSESDTIKRYDPIITTLSAFFQISQISATLQLAVSNTGLFFDEILQYSENTGIDLAIVPAFEKINSTDSLGPEGLNLASTSGIYPAFNSARETEMVHKLLLNAKINVAVFVSCGFSSVPISHEYILRPLATEKYLSDREFNKELQISSERFLNHPTFGEPPFENVDVDLPIVYIPFIGGKDDIYGLDLALGLIGNTNTNIVVVFYIDDIADTQLSLDTLNFAKSNTKPELSELEKNTSLDNDKFDSSYINLKESAMAKSVEHLVQTLGLELVSLSKSSDTTGAKVNGLESDKKSTENENPSPKSKKNKNHSVQEHKNWNKIKDFPDKFKRSKNQKDAANNKTNQENTEATSEADAAVKRTTKSSNQPSSIIYDFILDFVMSFKQQSMNLALELNIQGLSNDRKMDIDNAFIKSTKYSNLSFQVSYSPKTISSIVRHASLLRHCDIAIVPKNSNTIEKDIQNDNPNFSENTHTLSPTPLSKKISNIHNLNNTIFSDPKSSRLDNKAGVLGRVASALFESGSRASFLVIQSYFPTSSNNTPKEETGYV
ncbi:hypothetical protein BB560_001693 [Smittium megazygosporum]|uniref:Cation/H+ exchanger transmembrane domain-containing protein n=1 Tax=Smittium megazygosporum TaxID=133381 RepID=A0A2T9ZGX0_9FUNG|nr:hypothetical protein BB560_001693 [Smittium megazygosporum]